MLRNLASSLFLTERDAEFDDNAPKVKGRVTTTVPKAKEVRPLVEKCITLARRTLTAQRRADDLESSAERGTSEWKAWRESDQYHEWNAAVAPVVAARRRALKLLGDKQAVRILFEEIAPRFEDRPGGYTRIVRLAKPRLGDAGAQAIIEFVGRNDRATQKAQAPLFDDDAQSPASDAESAAEDVTADSATGEDTEEAVASQEESQPEADSDESKES